MFTFLRLLFFLSLFFIFEACKKTEVKKEPIIGLFTDFGLNDAYVAEMKGMIYSVNSEVKIVDLLHSTKPFDIREGAFLFDQAVKEFPSGGVFLAIVDPGVGSNREPILIRTKKKKYYIGPNNGVFSLVVIREGLDKAWKLNKEKYYRIEECSNTFHGRDIFAPIAAHLASGIDPSSLGTRLSRLKRLNFERPRLLLRDISGEVLHVDMFGNIITNIPKNFSSDIVKGIERGHLFEVILDNKKIQVPLVKTYGKVPKGSFALVVNSQNLLELSINQGSAASKFNKINVGDPIVLKP